MFTKYIPIMAQNINQTLITFFRGKDSSRSDIVWGEVRNFDNKKIIDFIQCPISEDKYRKALDVMKRLLEPHEKGDLIDHIAELYKVEDATMRLTNKRDHVIHALNTFLLGVYVNKYFLNEKVEMFPWKIAALFHDIAYPLEISRKIIRRYLDTVRTLKSNINPGHSPSPSIIFSPENFEILTKGKSAFGLIQEKVYDWKLDVDIEKSYSQMKAGNNLDHGILSSLTVLYLIDIMYENRGWKRQDFHDQIVPACSAIFLHNLGPAGFKGMKKDKASLPYLLKLCDELQNWDRPKGNSHVNPSSNYAIEIENKRLTFFVKDQQSKNDIGKNIACLNDPEIAIKILDSDSQMNPSN